MTMYVDMSNPSSRTKDFFPSPALSLSLAGVFRGAQAASAVEEDGESVGGSREDGLEISSENTGVTRSEEEADVEGLQEVDGGDKGKKKKRKKYHRHTADQIREMEALFKESPHPDEKQRQQLSKQLGLAPRQVKFWFQNRRTQIKAIQERHENSLLKTEVDRLRDENRSLRDNAKKACCPSCGFAPSNVRDAPVLTTEEQQLRIENAKLKAEIDKLRAAAGSGRTGGGGSPSSSCSGGNDACAEKGTSHGGYYSGLFGLGEKARIMETARGAMEELKKMASAGEPLWVRSVETGREILNYDEYVREFAGNDGAWGAGRGRRSIEASRETGVVFVDLPKLIQSFMDVNHWKEMFPSLISKAATIDVISSGEGDNKNGAAQLMFAEVQMLTPMVPSREFYFIRHCKQLTPDSWAIVDVSIDKLDDAIDASLVKCRKRPSGCIIQDKCNGHCMVIWVEHLECQKTTVHTPYRSVVSSGMAFGAKRWVTTLQLQCERLVFFMATNVPTKDSTGVATLAGRKSIMKLAQRMNVSFCRAVGASTDHTWTKVLAEEGREGMRVASRKNLSDPGEPIGLIVCAVSSVWLPVPPHVLFDFLREDGRKNEVKNKWDMIISSGTGGAARRIANLAKAQDRGNAVTVHATPSKDGGTTWVLQDTCTNKYEATVVYAPVEVAAMQPVMTGCDSSTLPVLPSGYAILPDGVEARPLVISSRAEEKATEGGCILTVAFQTLASSSPAAIPTVEAVESASAFITHALRHIKMSLECED